MVKSISFMQSDSYREWHAHACRLLKKSNQSGVVNYTPSNKL